MCQDFVLKGAAEVRPLSIRHFHECSIFFCLGDHGPAQRNLRVSCQYRRQSPVPRCVPAALLARGPRLRDELSAAGAHAEDGTGDHTAPQGARRAAA